MTAKSLSNHYVEVTFEGPMDATYGLPETYKIVSATDGSPLAVRAAQLRTDGTTALLTTDAQAKIDYLLSVNGTAKVTRPNAVPFAGSLKNELVLGFAVALSNTTVKLTFGEEVDATSAADPDNYVISDPDLEIVSAGIGAGDAPNMVTLTTSPQSEVDYTVKVVNLLGKNGRPLIDPEQNHAPSPASGWWTRLPPRSCGPRPPPSTRSCSPSASRSRISSTTSRATPCMTAPTRLPSLPPRRRRRARRSD